MRSLLPWRPWPRLPPRRFHGASLVGLGVLGTLLAPRALLWVPGAAPPSMGCAPSRPAARVGALFWSSRADGGGRARAHATGVLARESQAPAVDEVSVQARLQALFQEALDTLLPGEKVAPQVVVADPRFGDYQCNNAMSVFKMQKRDADGPPRWKSPRDVGEAIKDALSAESAEIFEEVSVAGPGFITVKLRKDWIESELRRSYQDGLHFRARPRQRVVIDYSSPNIAKEMHVGHLRSTILGDTIANLLTKLGHDVVRLNHVGDWGTQFGMLLEYMRRQESLEGDSFAIRDLQVFYRSAKEAFDKDADFKQAAQANVVALQSGEPWARDAWQRICQASRSEFEVVYNRLNINGLEERGESFYNEMLPAVLDELSEKGLIQEDGGAKCIFTGASKAPLIVQKADGGYGYDSTDCAAVLHRLKEEGADRVIYVIDNGQETHMRMVFEVAERVGWLQGRRLDFMGFGLVQGEDGKKFKTRSGDVVRLRDLLDEAASRAEAELKRRAGEGGSGGDDDDGSSGAASAEQLAERQQNAERIGIAAVKYFDLRQNRGSDYRFSYDAMLDPKGNTAVYILYAYARLSGILRKAGASVDDLDLTALRLEEPSERQLALRLVRLPEVLAQVEEDLLPSKLIDYVYGLAGDFTAFYTACPVVGAENEASRVMLCEAVRRTLQECFAILGISPLERL